MIALIKELRIYDLHDRQVSFGMNKTSSVTRKSGNVSVLDKSSNTHENSFFRSKQNVNRSNQRYSKKSVLGIEIDNSQYMQPIDSGHNPIRTVLHPQFQDRIMYEKLQQQLERLDKLLNGKWSESKTASRPVLNSYAQTDPIEFCNWCSYTAEHVQSSNSIESNVDDFKPSSVALNIIKNIIPSVEPLINPFIENEAYDDIQSSKHVSETNSNKCISNLPLNKLKNKKLECSSRIETKNSSACSIDKSLDVKKPVTSLRLNLKSVTSSKLVSENKGTILRLKATNSLQELGDDETHCSRNFDSRLSLKDEIHHSKLVTSKIMSKSLNYDKCANILNIDTNWTLDTNTDINPPYQMEVNEVPSKQSLLETNIISQLHEKMANTHKITKNEDELTVNSPLCSVIMQTATESEKKTESIISNLASSITPQNSILNASHTAPLDEKLRKADGQYFNLCGESIDDRNEKFEGDIYSSSHPIHREVLSNLQSLKSTEQLQKGTQLYKISQKISPMKQIKDDDENENEFKILDLDVPTSECSFSVNGELDMAANFQIKDLSDNEDQQSYEDFSIPNIMLHSVGFNKKSGHQNQSKENILEGFNEISIISPMDDYYEDFE